MIYIILIGIFGMGYLVFTGPALNYYFGLENAQKLLAFKSSGAVFGILSALFLQYLAVDVLTYDKVFMLLGLILFSAVILLQFL